ncbi:hypothetical protein EX30DRAFT_381281 [Ascodesmis nigricans]|uniref:FAM192A/Fyv6 N-terminal domain-containing protein n=1 Tax=Ascodesmis nigricans TaxID=341454 RepID=A0A4V3SJF8_9PEZI|nr:hypothetical protein EX30DRAFT_381281 [Ascodesmis nigricans]
MSSGFVPAGTIPPSPTSGLTTPSSASNPPSTAPSSSAPPPPTDSRSLYEILQANKAAKQTAFEESLKLSNQFQPLSEADVEFLDSVVDKQKREREERRRREEREVEGFRARQQMVEGVVEEEGVAGGWGKRKRGVGGRRRGLGLKVRGGEGGREGERGKEEEKEGEEGRTEKRVKSNPVSEHKSGTSKETGKSETEKKGDGEAKVQVEATSTMTTTTMTQPQKPPPSTVKVPTGGLGLVDYGSDDESD